MKKFVLFLASAIILSSCEKDEKQEVTLPVITNCDIQQTYITNSTKVTVANGIWGTVSSMEGNCMPIVGPGSTCKHCPVKRTVKIYAYTTTANAVPSAGLFGFYDSFNTTLVKQVNTDNEGFFQTDLPAGNYTMIVEENGKLYGCGIGDGQNGINPFTHTTGAQKVNFQMTYKAVF